MASPARRLLTVDEFLAWDDGTDRRYQLIAGEVVAMAPAREGHGRLVIALGAELRARLRSPCSVQAEAGIRLPHRNDSFYLADLAVSCAPSRPDRQWVADPVVLIEVLSPTTQAEDREIKLPDYQRLPSVQEIVLVASDRRRVETWQRFGGLWVPETITAEGVLRLESLGIELPLAAFYDGTGIG